MSTPTYGFDIETDTTINGLDPDVAAVVAVALVSDDLEVVLEGDERQLLIELDELVRSLPTGVIITWNGGGFDLPFVADRARRHAVASGIDLVLDPTRHGRRDPLPGHVGAYRARWHGHGHLDGYRLFRADVGASLHFSCGLKPLARMVGLPVIEVDRERIHELDDATRRAYVASDAYLARVLTQRRAGWKAGIDQVTASSGS